MKKLASVLAVALALTSAAAMASDGMVTINGKLTSNTCTINGGTGDITVNLPTLSTATLVAAGQVAGSTAFTFTLTNCTASSAQAYFEQSPNVSSLGNLKNLTVGGAGNVEVQLKNAKGTTLNLNNAAATQDDPNVYTGNVATGSGVLTYYAQYYATGATTAGDVKAQTTYSMIYN